MNKTTFPFGLLRASFIFSLLLVLASGCGNAASVEPTPAQAVESSPPSATAIGAIGEAPAANATEIPTVQPGLVCSLPMLSSVDWPVSLCETFDDNQNNWTIESQDNPYADYSIDIAEGKYALSYRAKAFAGFQRATLTWFDAPPARDFALSVSGRMDSSFQNISWGVAFRADDDSFFLFSIDNNNTYAFEIYENDGWISLISRRPYEGIRTGEENKLGILADGRDFIFYINDEEVGRFSGGLLKEEGIKLIVSVREGGSADFYFDDMVIQSRP